MPLVFGRGRHREIVCHYHSPLTRMGFTILVHRHRGAHAPEDTASAITQDCLSRGGETDYHLLSVGKPSCQEDAGAMGRTFGDRTK